MNKEDSMNKNLLFVAFGLVGAMTTPAEAAVQFCFKHNVDFIDSGLELDSPCDSYSPERCEDRWLDNDAYVARGIKATIQQKVSGVYTEIWSGYVDDGNGTDGAGCTPDLDPAGVNTGWYKLTLESKAKVNGDYVYVRDASNALAMATIVSYIGSDNTTYTYSFSGTSSGLTFERFNVLSAATQPLWYHDFNIAPWVYYYFDVNDSGSGSGSQYHANTGQVEIRSTPEDNSAHRKFIITHEMGHALLHDIVTSKYKNNSTFTDPGGTCTSATGNNHAVDTKEYQSAAMNEGFAHYYASIAFNRTDQDDCYFHHWKESRGTVDCEDTGGSLVEAYMLNRCYATSQSGRGVELDWWRTYWDLRVKGSVTDQDMRTWFQTADSWTDTDVYSKLNAAANDMGGTLNATWDDPAVPNNRIDF